MKFENTSILGLENAIYGMRLPMCRDFEDAKNKSDSEYKDRYFFIGEKDLKIATNLIKADSNGGGQPNSKFLRMIHVQVAITAPLYFWKELDTYKVSTVANSTSTMHKLASTPITMDCFELDDFAPNELIVEGEIGKNKWIAPPLLNYWADTIKYLECLRQTYLDTKDKRYWKELIRLLPESWLQTRMFDCNYSTLRDIYKWRKNHKLSEWHQFCEWIEWLPYAKELIIDEVGK